MYLISCYVILNDVILKRLLGYSMYIWIGFWFVILSCSRRWQSKAESSIAWEGYFKEGLYISGVMASQTKMRKHHLTSKIATQTQAALQVTCVIHDKTKENNTEHRHRTRSNTKAQNLSDN